MIGLDGYYDYITFVGTSGPTTDVLFDTTWYYVLPWA